MLTSGANTGKVSSVAYAGQTWTYAYGTNQTTLTEPNGKTRQIFMDVTGVKIVAQMDEAGRGTSYSYDSSDRVSKVVNPDGDANTGGFTSYVYDSVGRLIETDIVPKGGATGGTPNAGAAIVTKASYVTCDSTNATWCYKPQTTTDANGVVTTYAYDDNNTSLGHTNTGQVLSVTLPAVSSVQAQTRYTYAAQTPHSYDLNGNYVARPGVYRLTATSSCMTANLAACVNGVDERKTTIAYNTTNVLPTSTTISRGDGSLALTTAIAQYNNNGQVLVSDGPKSGANDEVYYFYDGLGRQVGMVGPDPDGTNPRHRHAGITSFDADGHVAEQVTGVVGTGTSNAYSGADAPTRSNQAYADWQAFYNDWQAKTQNSVYVQERNTNEFDSYGRPVIARHFIGNATSAKDVTQRSYDAMQRLDCEAVRLNSADYGNLGSIGACSLGTTGADGSHDRITKNNYDPVTGILTSTVSGYLTGQQRTDASKQYDTTGATSTGTLTWVEDAKGNRTSYFYDAFDRLIKTCYPLAGTAHASSTTDCAQTAYRTTTVTVPATTQAGTLPSSVTTRDNQVVNLSYDVIGRLTGKATGAWESYSYDNFNQVLTATNTTSGHSGTETYTYNSLGQLLSDQQAMGTVQYLYDAYGRRSQITYPGGPNLWVNYAYDNGDELTAIWENSAATVVTLDYDDYGRRAHLCRANGVTTTYGYDSSLRLGTITQGASGATFYNVTTFGYNVADQIASKSGTNAGYNYTPQAKAISYGINGLNQIDNVNGGSSFGYDGRGNLYTDGGSSTYTYNINNLLTSALQSGVTTTLGYDPSGRLLSISKTGFGTTDFLYDSSDLIAEYSYNGSTYTLTKRYVHGPGDDEPLVMYDYTNGGAKTWLHADDNGSVVLLTNATGSSGTTNTYDEYGLPGSTNTPARFGYTGQVWLPELQMYYYKARIYSPILGRFMQTDPIGYGDGMNWYAYVHGDPVNGSDPFGLCPDCKTDQSGDTAGAVTCSWFCSGITTVTVTADAFFRNLHKNENLSSQYNNSNFQMTGIPPIPSNIPGGPWTPSGTPGTFDGAKPLKGPRPRLQFVPRNAVKGSWHKPYWKRNPGGEKGWPERYDQNGDPITPEEAHPSKLDSLLNVLRAITELGSRTGFVLKIFLPSNNPCAIVHPPSAESSQTRECTV